MNITSHGRQVRTSFRSSLSGCRSPGGDCTRSRVLANAIRFRTMISAPKIAMVIAQPLAESPPPNLATSGRGSAWMMN